jgi:hypothetical protein
MYSQFSELTAALTFQLCLEMVIYVLTKGLAMKRKVEVLDKLDSGIRIAVVRYQYGTFETKILLIKKNI